jgi:hypothetical protein
MEEFRAYLAGLKLGACRPKLPTLHNTGVPSLAQWLAYGPTPQERWGASLNRYRARARDGMPGPTSSSA